ncbi:MAG TPA: hypothetical protein PLK63_01480 [Catalimonadaceae bacterium]|nr:hypothetical protein [Catalimonadaceae bacterium]
MLEIILIWILTGMLALLWGGLLDSLTGKFFAEGRVNIWLRFWSGLAVLSFFLGIATFFTPLTPLVKGILWTALLLPGFLKGQLFFSLVREIFQKLRSLPLVSWILLFVSMGISLLKASGRPEIFDEGAYHLPLIRMWENQGLVMGMANLNGHYGLNSTWHILSAFTNLSFLPFWKTEMSLNSLVAVVLGMYSATRVRNILKGSRLVSHWIVVFLPFLVFRNLLSSPSTDIPAIICTWFVLTHWLETIEKEESPWQIWPAFVVLPIWIVILKTSSAALLFIPAGALYLAVQEESWVRIRWMMLFGCLLLAPWILQNWLITGYAVFPIRNTAIGHPAWQVPIEAIDKKFYLSQFGDFAPPSSYTWGWFLQWIRAQNTDSRMIILLSFTTLISGLAIFSFLRRQRNIITIFLYLSVLALVLSWFLTITEPRYGFGALVFSALFPVGYFLSKISARWKWAKFAAISVLFLQGFNLMKTIRELPSEPIGVMFPAPVPSVKYQNYACGNFMAIVPVAYLSEVPSDKPVFCWDCPFPCVPLEGIEDAGHIYQLSGYFWPCYQYR